MMAMVIGKPLRRIKREIGIASILTLTLVSLIAVLMAMITMLDIRRERLSFYDSVEKRGEFLGNGLTNVFADHLHHARINELEIVADRVIASLPDIISIRIFRTDGRVIVDRQGQGDESSYIVGSARGPVISESSDVEDFTHSYDGDNLLITSPLEVSEAGVMGSAQFVFDQGPLNTEITEILLERAWQSSALIAIGITLAYLISRRVTLPLKTLAASAERIGDGNLEEPVSAQGA